MVAFHIPLEWPLPPRYGDFPKSTSEKKKEKSFLFLYEPLGLAATTEFITQWPDVHEITQIQR